MNIIDKAIEKISPQAALRRESARWKLQTMRAFQNSGYDESGAARNKNRAALQNGSHDSA